MHVMHGIDYGINIATVMGMHLCNSASRFIPLSVDLEQQF